MRTRVVKILTTLAQDTDTVFIFPVHDGSSDLCFAFPEGFGGKLRYFHIDLSPRFFNKSYILSGASNPRTLMQVIRTLRVNVTRLIYPACFFLSSSAMIFVS